MTIRFKRGHCFDADQARAEITERSLFLFEVHAEPGRVDDIHWHPWDTHIYLVEGEHEHHDPDGSITLVKAGDYQFTPAKALHGDRVTKRSRVIVGTSEPVDGTKKTNFAPEELD